MYIVATETNTCVIYPRRLKGKALSVRNDYPSRFVTKYLYIDCSYYTIYYDKFYTNILSKESSFICRKNHQSRKSNTLNGLVTFLPFQCAFIYS